MPVNKVHKRFLAAAVLVGLSVPLTAATANASVVDLASQSNVGQPPETTAEPVAEPTVEQPPAPEPAPVPEVQPEPVAEQPPAPQPEAPAPAAEPAPAPEPVAEPAPAVEQAPAPADQTQRHIAEEPQPAQAPVAPMSVAEESPAPVETPDEGDGDTGGGDDTAPEDGGTNEPDNPADPDPDAPIELESGITVDPKVETDTETGAGSVTVDGDTDNVEISVRDSEGRDSDATYENGRLSIEEYDDGKAYAIHFDGQDGKRKSVVIGDGENTPNQAVEEDVGVRQVENTTTMKLTNLAIGVKYFLSYQDRVHEFETEDTSYDFNWSLFDIDTSKNAVFDFTLNNLLGLHSTETEGELNLKFGYAAPTTTEPGPEEPGTEPDPDPADPNPTDPTDPVDPTDPTNPTDPVDPTDPTTPTDPVGPGDGGTEPGTPPEGGDGGETELPPAPGGGEGGDLNTDNQTGNGGSDFELVGDTESNSGQLTGGQAASEDEGSDSQERSDSILQELTRGSQEALAADGTDDTVAEAQGRELPYAADGAGSNLLESSQSSSSLLESLANPDQAEDRDETDDSELDVFGGPEDTASDDKSSETRADATPVLNASSGWLTGIMIAVGSAIVMFFAWLVLGKSRRGRHSGDA